jgi:predicted 3-demethylubiquinone-9 3-methyltransferase (glyoxalase superfamily)
MTRLESSPREVADREADSRTQKITTFLTYNDQAEEAMNLYVSVFKNSRIVSLVRSESDGPIPKGKVLNASFELEGQHFMAMDGGPHFSFAEGTSLSVDCETQEEIDHLWEKLSEGGEEQACGWLKDRFGVSWQIVPSVLGKMMSDPESGNSERAIEAMLKMSKLDIKTLQEAYEER